MSYSKPIDIKTSEGRKRFYNTRNWHIMRVIVLQEQPYCVECLKKGIKELANEVDHIIDIKTRPDLVFDKENLQSLCKSCHSKKTFSENKEVFKPQKFIVVNRKWNFDVSNGKAAEART